MPLDAYSQCPGGTGKKIKFCACGKQHLIGELQYVVDKAEAGHRDDALKQIRQLLESHPSRPCFLALQGAIQFATSNMEGLKATAAEFRQHHPENLVALAFSAIVSASELQVEQAVEQLQQSLEVSMETDYRLYEATYHALGVVAQALLYVGNYSAALGHLAYRAKFAPGDDDSALEPLRRLYALPEIPLLLRHHLQVKPDGANQHRLEDAERLAGYGCWRQTCAKLMELERELPSEPAVLAQLAYYQGMLGETTKRAQTLRRLASHSRADLDAAVEADATAQLLIFPHCDCRWRLSEDSAAAEPEALVEERPRDYYLNTWPNTPLKVLDGKAPVEVAGDPEYRIRILGAILLLELASERALSVLDLNELRGKLGLPMRDLIDPASISVLELPIVRLHMIQLDSLPDEQLRSLESRCAVMGARRAQLRVWLEMLGRFAQRAERSQICGSSESLPRTPHEVLELRHRPSLRIDWDEMASFDRALLEILEFRRRPPSWRIWDEEMGSFALALHEILEFRRKKKLRIDWEEIGESLRAHWSGGQTPRLEQIERWLRAERSATTVGLSTTDTVSEDERALDALLRTCRDNAPRMSGSASSPTSR